MKSRSIIKYAAIIGTHLAMISCTKDFKEINTNPNTTSKVLPQALLAPALTQTVGYNMSRSQRITNELMQTTVNMGDGDGKIFRYEIRAAEADYLWNNWYVQLANFKDIYTSAEELNNNSYMAVSLICQAWVFSMLTDTYGDIPYFNALKAKEYVLQPNFDLQKDIYTDLFAKLDQANELLKSGVNIQGSSDPLFNGSATKWRKFGNSLYLRLLLRVSAKPEMKAPDKIKEIVEMGTANYPIMTGNDDSAILRWTGVSPYVSPFATWRDADWYTPKLVNFFVDHLNEWSDPRVAKWATLVDGEYAGVPSGYPVGQAPDAKSAFPTALMTEPLLGNIMNYSELQFVLAEAAIKGWISNKTAQEYYETGTTNAITQWGFLVPDNYLNNDLVKWDDDADLENKMEKIYLQKYYSLFFTDLESWFEYRRTGHPVLPKGGGLENAGIMPARLNYPVYLQSSNGANYEAAVERQGPDNISTQVWWQKP